MRAALANFLPGLTTAKPGKALLFADRSRKMES